tara:strand:+ start:294 stop:1607 length:1314 start_codon:yes stop_codon:yes gene_type:complete
MNKILKVLCLYGLVNFLFFYSLAKSEEKESFNRENFSINTSYLNSRGELKDYILDTGDIINIFFNNLPSFSDDYEVDTSPSLSGNYEEDTLPSLSGNYEVDPQGEIFFPGIEDIKEVYVRGLTISELELLLTDLYKEILIYPKINIRITRYKPIRISVSGEVRKPGLYILPALENRDQTNKLKNDKIEEEVLKFDSLYNRNKNSLINSYSKGIRVNSLTTNSNQSHNIKRDILNTISTALKEAGGLTSNSDMSKIEVTRDIPLSEGGGRKKTVIDFNSYLRNNDNTFNLRLFDGDSLFIPSLEEKDKNIVPYSVLRGISPKTIEVTVLGQVETPGVVRIPLEGTLSDVMNLTGPRKPLSGKIFLIRYNNDGTLLRKNIKYSSTASPGSKGNPYLSDDDMVTVKNSILGRTAGTLKAVTEPFVGIYSTKETIKGITGN